MIAQTPYRKEQPIPGKAMNFTPYRGLSIPDRVRSVHFRRIAREFVLVGEGPAAVCRHCRREGLQ